MSTPNLVVLSPDASELATSPTLATVKAFALAMEAKLRGGNNPIRNDPASWRRMELSLMVQRLNGASAKLNTVVKGNQVGPIVNECLEVALWCMRICDVAVAAQTIEPPKKDEADTKQ